MSPIVYRISVLLGVILAEVPVGTNLALFWLLCALLSGRLLLSRPVPVAARPSAGSERRRQYSPGRGVFLSPRSL